MGMNFSELVSSDVWISSDLHFNHDRPFIWKERGFTSVDEMNEGIINNFNSVVKEKDVLFLLGDCMLGDNKKGIELLKRLNGRKYLVIGNHDSKSRVQEYTENNIFCMIDNIGISCVYGDRVFILTHFPMAIDGYYRHYNIHGHIHTKDNFFTKRNYNVCLEAHDCFPVNIKDIVKAIEERK